MNREIARKGLKNDAHWGCVVDGLKGFFPCKALGTKR
jgi:hypothetical protein